MHLHYVQQVSKWKLRWTQWNSLQTAAPSTYHDSCLFDCIFEVEAWWTCTDSSPCGKILCKTIWWHRTKWTAIVRTQSKTTRPRKSPRETSSNLERTGLCNYATCLVRIIHKLSNKKKTVAINENRFCCESWEGTKTYPIHAL